MEYVAIYNVRCICQFNKVLLMDYIERERNKRVEETERKRERERESTSVTSDSSRQISPLRKSRKLSGTFAHGNKVLFASPAMNKISVQDVSHGGSRI